VSSFGSAKNETDPRYDRWGRALFADLREFSCERRHRLHAMSFAALSVSVWRMRSKSLTG
jgi:hypothetical protein